MLTAVRALSVIRSRKHVSGSRESSDCIKNTFSPTASFKCVSGAHSSVTVACVASACLELSARQDTRNDIVHFYDM